MKHAKTHKTPRKTGIVSLVAYIGNDSDARAYLETIKRCAEEDGKKLSDFVLDAIEAYVISKSKKQTPKIETGAVPKQPNTRTIDYSEIEDPPAPQVDASQIPDSRPRS